jgi:hypothetical protein
MWLFKIPVKILILPVILVLGIFNVLGNVATKLSCYVFGPAMFLMFGLAFFYLTQQSWLNVSILTVLGIACFAIPMLAGLALCITEDRNRLLMKFLVS